MLRFVGRSANSGNDGAGVDFGGVALGRLNAFRAIVDQGTHNWFDEQFDDVLRS